MNNSSNDFNRTRHFTILGPRFHLSKFPKGNETRGSADFKVGNGIFDQEVKIRIKWKQGLRTTIYTKRNLVQIL